MSILKIGQTGNSGFLNSKRGKDINIEIEGMDELKAVLQKIPEAVRDAAENSFRKSILDLQGKAQILAPIDLGDLRGSAYSDVGFTEWGLEAVVGFTEPYALLQHEDMEFNHPKGGQAKYLEQPLKENIVQYTADLSETIKKAMNKIRATKAAATRAANKAAKGGG